MKYILPLIAFVAAIAVILSGTEAIMARAPSDDKRSRATEMMRQILSLAASGAAHSNITHTLSAKQLLATIKANEHKNIKQQQQQEKILSGIATADKKKTPLRQRVPKFAAAATGSAPRLIDLVDTRFGTGGSGWGEGSLSPGPTLPHAPLRMNPITSLGLEPIRIPFQSESGYSSAGAGHPPSGGWGGALLHDRHLEGVSVTSVVGAGEADWQNFLSTAVRLPSAAPTAAEYEKVVTNAGYKSRFSHETEIALPGYYSAELTTWDAKVEAAAIGTFTGIVRLTCYGSDSRPCAVVLDLCHGAPMASQLLNMGASCKMAQVLNYTVAADGSQATLAVEIHNRGSFTRACKLGYLPIFAHIVVSAAPGTSLGKTPLFFQGGKKAASPTAATTSGMSAVIIPVTASSSSSSAAASGAGAAAVAEIRTAISFISADYARVNFAQQSAASTSFEQAVQAAQQQWENRLQRFKIETDGSNDLSTFYAAMYINGVTPTAYNEWDGSFMGLDLKQHQAAPGGVRRFSDLSLWDVFRAQAPMLFFTDPAVQRDIVLSMAQMAEEEGKGLGWAVKWPMANCPCRTMVGLHGCTITATLVMQQLNCNENTTLAPRVQAAFDACADAVTAVCQSNMPRNGNNGHYSPGRKGYGRGAGGTLEYTINARAIANAATRLGNQSLAAAMAPFANASQNLWNAAAGMFCDRLDTGAWQCTSKGVTDKQSSWMPHPWEAGNFIESNAELYKFYQPGDLKALTLQFGNGSLLHGIDSIASSWYFQNIASPAWTKIFNGTLPGPFNWLGNEPACLMPMQMSVVCGGPSATSSVDEEQMCNSVSWLSNHFQRAILDAWFAPGFSNFNGNSDYGAMQATFTGLQIGFYPVPPGDPSSGDIFYALCAPIFRKSTFTLPSSSRTSLILIADSSCKFNTAAGTNKNYLVNATVQGVPLRRPVVSHKQLYGSSSGFSVTPTITFFCAQEPVTFFYGKSVPVWNPKQSDSEMLKEGEEIVVGVIDQVLKNI